MSKGAEGTASPSILSKNLSTGFIHRQGRGVDNLLAPKSLTPCVK
jgi:hypothetical protein